MCWSLGASGIFAVIGLIVAIYFIYKKESKLIWIPLIYFALMEFLQAITYFSVGQCFSPENQMLTILSYLHIAFQPIFINMIVMYFIPQKTREKIFWPVMVIASMFSLMMILKLYPFAWAGLCTIGTTLCGERLCSFMGNWHLAWSVPLNGFGFSAMAYYYMGIFLLPLVYGSWKTTIYSLVTGPVIALSLTPNPNEWPAVWCLLSVAIILMVAIPSFRNAMRVKRWYFWKYGF